MQLHTRILIGMLLGAALGVLVGPNARLLPQTAVRLPATTVFQTADQQGTVPEAGGVRRARILQEHIGPPAMLHVAWDLGPREAARLRAAGVSAEVGLRYTGWIRADAPGLSRYAPLGQTLVDATEWLGRLFLALIKLVVVPLILCSLVVGVASLGDPRRLGRLGGLTVGYFTVTTILALIIGLGCANLMRPGQLVAAADREALLSAHSADASDALAVLADAPSLVDQLVAIVPSNPFEALARGDMLAVVFFALLLGVALTLMPPARARPALRVFESLNDAMVTIVKMVMKLAPLGVAALLFEVVGSTGLSVLGALGAYALVVLLGLTLHVALIYASVIRWWVKLSPWGFLRAIRDALLFAFSTSSSSATLPVTKKTCEDRLGVDNQVTSFVLPIGATVNMDGTALYQGVAAVFIAQVYGMHLGPTEQVKIVLAATLASVGAAGVPGAGMITLAMVLSTIGVPTEGVALVLGVDRVLDMLRTTTNVIGDCTATVFVARAQGATPTLRPAPDAPAHRVDGG